MSMANLHVKRYVRSRNSCVATRETFVIISEIARNLAAPMHGMEIHMKKIQKIVAVACSAALACSMGCGVAFAAGSATTNTTPDSVQAGDTIEEDTAEYTVTSATTVSYTKTTDKTVTTIVIPNKVGDMTVTGVEAGALAKVKATKLIVKAKKVPASDIKAALMANGSIKVVKIAKKKTAKKVKKWAKGKGITVKVLKK